MRVWGTAGMVALIGMGLGSSAEARRGGAVAKRATAVEVVAEGTAEDHVERGLSWFAQGAFRAALAEHEASLRIEPTPERRLRVARCREALGQDDLARDLYAAVADQTDDPYAADEAQRRLADLKVRVAERAAAAPTTPAPRAKRGTKFAARRSQGAGKRVTSGG